MIIYLDKDIVPDIENIPPEVISYVIGKAQNANTRYNKLNDYYLGKYPNSKQASKDSVNVIVNYAKYVVDIALGYYLGDPVKYDNNALRDTSALNAGSLKVAVDNDGQLKKAEQFNKSDEEDKIDISPLINCYTSQTIADIDTKIGKGIGIFGDCAEVLYASSDEKPVPKSAYYDPTNIVVVRDDTVEHKDLFAIVWEQTEDINKKKYYRITIYTDKTIALLKSEDLEEKQSYILLDKKSHYFGAVPVITYENNDEKQGDFEQIISLIDAYNDLMSNRLTDKKKFVNALLAFFGFGLNSNEVKLTEEQFIENVPLDARIEYIQKTFDENSVQILADELVKAMHKITMTVDMSDEQFAGNSSGQALKLKLLTMNMLVKNKIRSIEKGLKRRFELYNNWLTFKREMEYVSTNDIDIVFTINMPIAESEIVSTVEKLQGIVDDQTLLSLLWFISDPSEALENIKKQKLENQETFMTSMGQGNDDGEEEVIDDE